MIVFAKTIIYKKLVERQILGENLTFFSEVCLMYFSMIVNLSSRRYRILSDAHSEILENVTGTTLRRCVLAHYPRTLLGGGGRRRGRAGNNNRNYAPEEEARDYPG
jgi:hypothetical protein